MVNIFPNRNTIPEKNKDNPEINSKGITAKPEYIKEDPHEMVDSIQDYIKLGEGKELNKETPLRRYHPWLGEIPGFSSALSLATDAAQFYNRIQDALKDPRYAIYSVVNVLNPKSPKIAGFTIPQGMLDVKDRLDNGVADALDSVIGNKRYGVLTPRGPVNTSEEQQIPERYTRDRTGIYNIQAEKLEKSKDLEAELLNAVNSSKLLEGVNGVDRDPNPVTVKSSKAMREVYEKLMASKSWETVDLSYFYKDGDTVGSLKAPFQGVKTLSGFSLDSSHLWDILMYPYTDSSGSFLSDYFKPSDPTNPTDSLSSKYYAATEIPELEAGVKPIWVPALNYEYSDWTYKTDSKSLGIGVNQPVLAGVDFNNEFSMTILDDEESSMFRLFKNIAGRSINLVELGVAPYKQVSLVIELFILMPGARIKFHRKLIAILSKFDSVHTGTEDPAVLLYNVNFTIVGELPPLVRKQESISRVESTNKEK